MKAHLSIGMIANRLGVPVRSVRYWIRKKWMLSHRIGKTIHVKEDYFNWWKREKFPLIRSGKFNQVNYKPEY